jgi:Heterokaryon incompatibility protein (HET)
LTVVAFLRFFPGEVRSRYITGALLKEANGSRSEIPESGEALALTDNTFSGKCEDQVRKWLTNCIKTHGRCNQDWRTKESYPARLLNIAQEDQFNLEIFENNARHPRYVTLSHCWQAGIPMQLTASTQNPLKEGLPISELPKRFQDAVKIARWMEIDYIWIDALCIVQDSKEDWLVQSTRMGDIYTNSYCNIAATSADHTKGCFTNRYTKMVEPYLISNPRSNDSTATHVVGYDDFWGNSLLDTPLHNRGWVLQERLLSARTIHFGQEQIFWECRGEMACEAYPRGIPIQFRNRRTRAWRQSDRMLDPKNKKLTGHSSPHLTFWQRFSRNLSSLFWLRSPEPATTQLIWAYEIWSKTIERYMECKLSFGEDKLVAISGIAQKVAEATEERYLAGLWDNPMLAQSLLWYVLSRRQADSTPSLRSASQGCRNYRAPSWSWASLEAKVVWNWPVDCENVLIDILSTTVEGAEGSKMGRVSSATMNIEGSLFEANLQVMSKTAKGFPEEDGRYALLLKDCRYGMVGFDLFATQPPPMEPSIYLDTPLMPKSSSIETYLLPICTGWQGRSGNTVTRVAGLLLKKASSSNSEVTYERIGIFGLDQTQANTLYDVSSGEFDCVKRNLIVANKSFITLV